jgi:holin-like protein
MAALQGLAWLLGLQALGELIARGLGLPFPGPVIGLLLLVPALSLEPVQRSVRGAAEFLLSHLSLLFVPVGVGVMTHLTLLADNGLRLAVVIVASTLVGLFATAWTLHKLMRGPLSNDVAAAPENDEAAP